MSAYADLIEGGMEGAFFDEVRDYFYYAQLRSQGEDSTAPRRITGTVPLDQIPNLMRALGFYPTEKELQNMCSEVKYSRYTVTGEAVEEIDLDSFVKLYVNHRPVFGIGKQQIVDAFAVLGASTQSGRIPWAQLTQALRTRGEVLPEEELAQCMACLVGPQAGDEEGKDGGVAGGGDYTAVEFAEQVLGFEDYDAAAEEAAAAAAAAAEAGEGKDAYEGKGE